MPPLYRLSYARPCAMDQAGTASETLTDRQRLETARPPGGQHSGPRHRRHSSMAAVGHLDPPASTASAASAASACAEVASAASRWTLRHLVKRVRPQWEVPRPRRFPPAPPTCCRNAKRPGCPRRKSRDTDFVLWRARSRQEEKCCSSIFPSDQHREHAHRADAGAGALALVLPNARFQAPASLSRSSSSVSSSPLRETKPFMGRPPSRNSLPRVLPRISS